MSRMGGDVVRRGQLRKTGMDKVAAHWIGGEWIRGEASSRSPCIDPATGETIAMLTEGGTIEATAAIEAARQAFETTS